MPCSAPLFLSYLAGSAGVSAALCYELLLFQWCVLLQVGNPDQESEIALLRSYAPTVELATIRRLTAAFMDLRKMMEEGQLVSNEALLSTAIFV